MDECPDCFHFYKNKQSLKRHTKRYQGSCKPKPQRKSHTERIQEESMEWLKTMGIEELSDTRSSRRTRSSTLGQDVETIPEESTEELAAAAVEETKVEKVESPEKVEEPAKIEELISYSPEPVEVKREPSVEFLLILPPAEENPEPEQADEPEPAMEDEPEHERVEVKREPSVEFLLILPPATEDKPEVSCKKFGQLHLKSHMKLHHPGYKFECDLCGFKTARKQSFASHINARHLRSALKRVNV